MKVIDVIVGGQYGSEGKGHVTHRLIRRCVEENYGWAQGIVNIRVAGPNAGHTVYTDGGVALPLRTIPVGVATPDAELYLAAGSEVDLTVLASEIQMIQDAGLSIDGRLWIDPEATVLSLKHIEQEMGMHERMGSTGKGIGAARSARIMRTALRIRDLPNSTLNQLMGKGILIGRPELHNRQVFIEGTQGYGLGLHAGFYPQCTSSDCRAIDFLSMAGISPWTDIWKTDRGYATPVLRVWVCVRPNPIRVAGNSGPMRSETTWEDLGLPQEYTTVTKKVRRVGGWDGELVRDAVEANGGAPVVRLAFTMADQVMPFLSGKTGRVGLGTAFGEDDWTEFKDRIQRIEQSAGAPVELITTGPNTGLFR